MRISKNKLRKLIYESLAEAAVSTDAAPLDVTVQKKKKTTKVVNKEKSKNFVSQAPVKAINTIAKALEVDELKVNTKKFLEMFPDLPDNVVKALNMLSFVELAIDSSFESDDKNEIGLKLEPTFKAKLEKMAGGKKALKKLGLNQAFIKIKPPKKGDKNFGYQAGVGKSMDLSKVKGLNFLPKGTTLDVTANIDGKGFSKVKDYGLFANINVPFK